MIKKNFIPGRDWFFEAILPAEDPDFTWGFSPEKIIYSGKSKFQKIDIYETKHFGRILTLDDLVQLSTVHEFIYHETLVHPAFFYHKNPKRVLIIGGGDGGTLREVVKYPVKEIFMVDIDKKIIEISKKYLRGVSNGAFNDKRLKLIFADALNFVKNYNDYFDIIINDLTDPVGPSLDLWSAKFYSDIRRALKKDGVAGFQTGCIGEDFDTELRYVVRRVFPYFKVHKAYVGCFPFGEHTFSFGSKKIDFDKMNLKEMKAKFKKIKLRTRYYSPEIHFSSKVFPK
jgi:spermidine synthase